MAKTAVVIVIFMCGVAQVLLNPVKRNIEVAKAAAKTCSEKTGADGELAVKTLKGEVKDIDPSLHEFIACFMEGVGFIKDGVMQYDFIGEALPAIMPEDKVEITKEAIKTCDEKKIVGTDIVDTAVKNFICFRDLVHP